MAFGTVRQGSQLQSASANPEEASALTRSPAHWCGNRLVQRGNGWEVSSRLTPIYADLARVGPEAFHAFGYGYLSRVAVVLLPLGVMWLAWGLLLWLPHSNVPRPYGVGNCRSLRRIHRRHAICGHRAGSDAGSGFSETLYARLMWSNGIRSVLFTAVGVLSARRRSESMGQRSSHGSDNAMGRRRG